MAKTSPGFGRKSKSTGVTSSSTTKPATARKQWTVMVYMAAAKEDGETERAAIRDLREMERVGSTKNVHLVVQLDRGWPGFPERYYVEKGRSRPVPIKGALRAESSQSTTAGQNAQSSSGNPDVLLEFLTSSRAAYRAKHYLLVLWGHAYGLGFGRDHGDPLTVRELARVLKLFRQGRGGQLDLLGTNACAMSYAEAAYELKDAAQFLIASEITMPFAGWPYASILERIGTHSNAAEVGELIIDEFMSSFDRKGVALSLLNLGKAQSLSTRVSSLAAALKKGIATPDVSIQVADAFLDSAHGDVRPIVDLFDLCTNLSKVGDAVIVTRASRLMADLKPIVDLKKITQEPLGVRRKRLIVKHEADPDFEGLHGLGIFAPAVTSGADLKRLELRERDYRGLKLMRATKYVWAQLVYHDLGSLLESTNAAIAELVAGTGASAGDDRQGVSQLLVAVTRSFEKLDATLARAEGAIGHALGVSTAAPSRLIAARIAAQVEPSLPFLRLTIDSQATLDEAGREGSLGPALPLGGPRDEVNLSLRVLEDGLASVERLLRRVLTNGRLGLGAGDPPFKLGLGAGDPPFKPGLGAGDPPFKLGLGAGDPPFKLGLGDVDDPFKLGLGDVDDPFKLGLGDVDDPFKVGFGVTTEGVVTAGSMLTVVHLFTLVAMSLRGLESTLAMLEATVLGSNLPLTISDEEKRQRTAQQAGRLFRTLRDQVVGARETCFFVLRHPTQGLGPGVIAGAGRRHLASVGGLSSRNLQLL